MSPVIGVILMVAITVILAAVIGTFVLDLGQSAGKSAPQASLTVDINAGNSQVNVSHQGGDSLDAKRTKVVIKDKTSGGSITYNATSSSSVLSVGGTVSFDTANGNVDGSPWGAMNTGAGGNSLTISQGDQYQVQFIDMQSQRVIYKTTVTA